MNDHPSRRVALLAVPREAPSGDEFPYDVKTIRLPRRWLIPPPVYLAAAVLALFGACCYTAVKHTPFEALVDPYRTVVAQIDREVERDPGTLVTYRRIGFVFERSVDAVGVPHWRATDYVSPPMPKSTAVVIRGRS